MPAQLKNISFGTSVALASDIGIPVASATTLGGIKIGENLSITSSGVLSASGGDPSKLIDACGNTVMDASCGTIYGNEQYIPFGTGIEAPEIKANYDFVIGDDGAYICGSGGSVVINCSGGLIICGNEYSGVEAGAFSGNYAYLNCGVYTYGDMVASGGLVVGNSGYVSPGSIIASSTIECCGSMTCYGGIHAYATCGSSNDLQGNISFYSGTLDYSGAYFTYCGNTYEAQFLDFEQCGTTFKVLGFYYS